MKIRVRVGTSRIAGQGLFAAQDIRQGTKIIRYIGQKITHEESDRRLAAGNVYIFGLDERYALDGSTCKNTARYINHSCDPNCQTEQFGNTISTAVPAVALVAPAPFNRVRRTLQTAILADGPHVSGSLTLARTRHPWRHSQEHGATHT